MRWPVTDVTIIGPRWLLHSPSNWKIGLYCDSPRDWGATCE